MKLCICGIGGAGGSIAENFLENVDISSGVLSHITDANHISLGSIAGLWIDANRADALNKQSFFKDLEIGGYPGFIIPHDAVLPGCDIQNKVKEIYGYDVKSQGFVRDAQYLKAIYEIFETDKDVREVVSKSTRDENSGESIEMKRTSNPIFDKAWEAVKKYTILGKKGDCDGIIFIVSFGGGTGTGFINPIIDRIREGGNVKFPVFVLGILTEPGDSDKGGQVSLEGQRYLAAISAIYDLLTLPNSPTGIMLIDNELLKDRVNSSDFKKQNKFIYDVMKPMIADRNYPGENPDAQAMQKEFTRNCNQPPILVPFYWSEPITYSKKNLEEDLVSKALDKGKLFYHSPKPDKAFVFCRGFVDKEKIIQAISKKTGLSAEISSIQVYRKIGKNDNEILILLRNPYGCNIGNSEGKKAYQVEGSFENKFHRVINSALKYMKTNTDDLFYRGTDIKKKITITEKTEDHLKKFFFGIDGNGETGGLAFELSEAMKWLENKNTPSAGQFFQKPLYIFKEDKCLFGEKFDKRRKSLIDDDLIELIDKRINDKLNEHNMIRNVPKSEE